MKSPVVKPGATIGVLGGGQLGRMFAIAARRMGYRVHTFSPDADTPTGQISDVEVRASYDDLDEVRNFASRVQVLTFEFENVPFAAAAAAAEVAPVRPHGCVLHVTQDRGREKSFLEASGIPCTPFRRVRALDELQPALREIGLPAVLKTAGFGYDGKGQRILRSEPDAAAAWQILGPGEFILEAFIDFEREVSIVAARGVDGSFAPFEVVENAHVRHVLDVTIAPASLPAKTRGEAIEIARVILEQLDVVGVLCVEFFVTRDGRLLVNELAPRPHNSGHYSLDACVTSQFEQQLRAVCGLALGSPEQLRPAAMVNLLGDLWESGEPDWQAASAFPEVKIHLYGKLEARPGRKMGHLTALSDSPESAARIALAARQALRG